MTVHLLFSLVEADIAPSRKQVNNRARNTFAMVQFSCFCSLLRYDEALLLVVLQLWRVFLLLYPSTVKTSWKYLSYHAWSFPFIVTCVQLNKTLHTGPIQKPNFFEAWKKYSGFDGAWTRVSQIPVGCYYQLSHEATHWERNLSPAGQIIWFFSIYYLWSNSFAGAGNPLKFASLQARGFAAPLVEAHNRYLGGKG